MPLAGGPERAGRRSARAVHGGVSVVCVCEKPLDDDAKSMRITLELSSKRRKKDPKTRDKQMDSRKKCLDRFDKRNWRHLISYYNSSPCRHCYSLRALP